MAKEKKKIGGSRPGADAERLAYAVLAAVGEIPPGRVASYGQIARMIGRDRNSRLVGKILSNAEFYGDYPCHRVVNHAGRLAPCFPEQRRLLAEEGVGFLADGRVDMAKFRMDDGAATSGAATPPSIEGDNADSPDASVVFRHRRIIPEALAAFGFRRARGGAWIYEVAIADGAMTCEVAVSGETSAAPAVRVIDAATGDEYAPWRMPGAVGAFVGKVRGEVASVLRRIAAACSAREVFKSDLAHRIAGFAREKWGEELEYLWRKFPENAVLRRRDTKKWYAAILRLKRSKLGFDSDETVEIADIRTTDGTAALGSLALPGYHMNKKRWFTVVLDGGVPFGKIAELLEASREVAK